MALRKSLLLSCCLILVVVAGFAGCGTRPQESTQSKPAVEQKKPVDPFASENYKADLVAYLKDKENFVFKPDTLVNTHGQVTSRGILKDDRGKQIDVTVSEKGNFLDYVGMGVWLNGDDTPANKDIAYISKLLARMYPNDTNEELARNGVADAFANKRSTTTRNGVDFRFEYIKDAGGTKGENAIFFSVNKAQPLKPSGPKIDVDFAVEPQLADGRMRISARTNLPDGMQLIVSLGKEGFSASDKVVVKNGAFVTAQFSNNGNALTAGSYNLVIRSPMPAMQSQAVRDIIGNKGGNLTGQFVNYSDKWDDYTVFYKQRITVK